MFTIDFRRDVHAVAGDGNGVTDANQQMVHGCEALWETIEIIDLDGNPGAMPPIPHTLMSTHVFGIGIDDEVSYRRESMTGSSDLGSHRDDLNTLTSVTDEAGAVRMRFEYGDYGAVRFYDPGGREVADARLEPVAREPHPGGA